MFESAANIQKLLRICICSKRLALVISMVSATEKALLHQARRDIILSSTSYFPTVKEALRAQAKFLDTSATAILNGFTESGAVNFAQHEKGRHIGRALHERYRGLVCSAPDEVDALDAKYVIYLAERAARSEIDFLQKPEALLEMLFPHIDLSSVAKDPAVGAQLFASIDELRQRSVDELVPLRAVIAATSFMGTVGGFRTIRERQLLSLYGGHIALRIVRDPEEYRYWVNWLKEHANDLSHIPASFEPYSKLHDMRLVALERFGSFNAHRGKAFWSKNDVVDEFRKIRKLAQAADATPDLYRELAGGGIAATTFDYVLGDIESLNPDRRLHALSLWRDALEVDLEAFDTMEWAQIDLERIVDFHLEHAELELAEAALRHHLQLEDASELKSPRRKTQRDQRFAMYYERMAQRSDGKKRDDYLELALKYKKRG